MNQVAPIDRGSFEPPYAQLARSIRESIARGEYRPGDRLPSEAELCAAYGVSPMTVRRAIAELVREDVAVTEHGRGTFVKVPQLGTALFDLSELQQYLADPDIEAHILEARIVSPSARVCEKLDVGEDERVISIKRLRRRGEEPLFYHSEYLVFDPARPLVEAELGVTALQDLFSGATGADINTGASPSMHQPSQRRRPPTWAKRGAPRLGYSSTSSTISRSAPRAGAASSAAPTADALDHRRHRRIRREEELTR